MDRLLPPVPNHFSLEGGGRSTPSLTRGDQMAILGVNQASEPDGVLWIPMAES